LRKEQIPHQGGVDEIGQSILQGEIHTSLSPQGEGNKKV